MVKIRLHSIVDLITNSSTTIYTWYDNSIKPIKELLQEILKIAGSDKLVDEVFKVGVFYDYWTITDIWEDGSEYFDFDIDNFIPKKSDYDDLIKKIINGDEKKPSWIIKLEEYAGNNMDRAPENDIYIKSVDPQYDDLEQKILDVIKSPNTNAEYDG